MEMTMEIGNVRLGVIVVNYFSSRSAKDFLESLKDAASGCETYVCVVDNSCDDEEFQLLTQSLEDLRQAFARLQVVRSKLNGGYGRGNNLGWTSLECYRPEVVLIANPDIILSGGDFAGAMRRVRGDRHTLFGAPTQQETTPLSGLGAINLVTGKTRQLRAQSQFPKSSLVYPGGHFLATSAETWVAIGGFSPDFFLYGEEADLTLRMKRLFPTSKVDVLTNILVGHSGGLTTGVTGDSEKSVTTYRHGTRSSIILFRKHRELRCRWPLIAALRVIYAIEACVRSGPRSGFAVIQGVMDGILWRRSREGSP